MLQERFRSINLTTMSLNACSGSMKLTMTPTDNLVLSVPSGLPNVADQSGLKRAIRSLDAFRFHKTDRFRLHQTNRDGEFFTNGSTELTNVGSFDSFGSMKLTDPRTKIAQRFHETYYRRSRVTLRLRLSPSALSPARAQRCL